MVASSVSHIPEEEAVGDAVADAVADADAVAVAAAGADVGVGAVYMHTHSDVKEVDWQDTRLEARGSSYCV